MEKTKKPAIRFDGFCSEWTKYEIRDFIEDYTEKTTVQNQYPVLTSSQQQGIVFQEEYFADRQVTTSENVGYFILPFGFFTYRSRSDNSVFVFNRNDIIDRGIISYYYPVFRPNNIDSNFLLRRLNVGTAKQIVKIVEGTGQKVLNHDKFKKLSISVPDEKECAKIGSFFETIDQQITLAQRKYDKLLTFKKSMLEKLFPQNGAKEPEVRFAGFDGEWERRKLRDLYEPVTQKNDLTYGINDNITVASMQYKTDIKVTDVDYLRTYNVFLLGDIAFEGHQSKEFRYGRFVENDIGNGIVSHIFTVFRPKCEYDLSYWKYAINNEKLMRPILSCCTKASTMMNDLVAKDFLDSCIRVPTIDEQRKIGAFLKSLDELVSLYGAELEKLKNIKSALLEKMFV